MMYVIQLNVVTEFPCLLGHTININTRARARNADTLRRLGVGITRAVASARLVKNRMK